MNDCNPITPAGVGDKCPWAPAIVRGHSTAQVCFPEFCYSAEAWVGAPYIVYRFFLSGILDTVAFAPLTRYATVDYVLAVEDRGRHFYFWEVDGVHIPGTLYAGEPISGDGVFEIWTTPNVQTNLVEAFCIPASFVKQPCGEARSASYQTTGNKKLWARFCADGGTPTPSGPYGYGDIKFSLEKDC